MLIWILLVRACKSLANGILEIKYFEKRYFALNDDLDGNGIKFFS